MNEVSHIKKQLKTLESELNELKEKQSHFNRSITNKKKEIEELNNKIDLIKSNKIQISDHAILRYLERVNGINVEEIKSKILNEEVLKQHQILGSGKFPVDNLFKVVIKDNTVVTILSI